LRKRYSTKHPGTCPGTRASGTENSHGARRVRRGFWRHGTDFKGLWRDRDTILIESSLVITLLLFVTQHRCSVAVEAVKEPVSSPGAEF